MQSENKEIQEAKQEFDRIRSVVRTVPPELFKGAPEWMLTIEDMRDFFSSTAKVWDRVFGTDEVSPFYRAVAKHIKPTQEEVAILVLGCGTGLELDDIFLRAPDALVTGIDLASGMLAELRKKFVEKEDQIELIEGSYVDMTFGEQRYDYVVATLTMHHLTPEAKLDLYRNVRASLKPTGCYIEGDTSTTKEEEEGILRLYRQYVSVLPGGDRAEWNYDMPLSPETQERLLLDAGFSKVTLEWEECKLREEGKVVFVAKG